MLHAALLVLPLLGAFDDERFPLGEAHFEISATPEAQVEFDRGIVLLHHMTYEPARAAFEHVVELDPACAMGHFGIAMTYFQPLWPNRPSEGDMRVARAAVARARELGATDRERRFIEAVGAFFDDEDVGHGERLARWERAMEELHARIPGDHEAATLYALAHLSVAPASAEPMRHNRRAAAIVLAVHAENPRHPGAVHYLIHANDIRGRESEALDIVRSYADIAPDNPHALHMPTHIYTRLGDWPAVIAGNRKAASAALRTPTGENGEYVWDEFSHALEYQLYAYLQRGDDVLAGRVLARLRGAGPLMPTFKTAFNTSSMPARYALERRQWKEAAELTPRESDAVDWDRFAWPESITWFARGIGAARLGRHADAARAIERMGALEDSATQRDEPLFATQIRILRLGAEAWDAQSRGENELALTLMETAAALEYATPKPPATPAPTLPAFEMLGELLMELGSPEQAVFAFERSLEMYPNRFHSLLGASQAARARGDDERAKRYATELRRSTSPLSKRPALAARGETHDVLGAR